MTEQEILKELEKRIAKEYKDTEAVIRQKIAYFTKEFDKDNKLHQQMVKDGKMTQKEYKDWYKNQMFAQKWSNKMASEIADDLTKTTETASKIINNDASKMYLQGVMEASKELEPYDNFDVFDTRQIKRIADKNSKHLPKANPNIPKEERWNEKRIRSSLMQSAIKGESVQKLAGRLRTVVGMGRTSAIRNARTMMTASHNMGKLDLGEEALEMGLDVRKKWIAIFDNRTRDSHALLHGEVVDMDEEFSNGLMFPADPDGDPAEVYNCRCNMVITHDPKRGGMSKEEFEQNVAENEARKEEFREANRQLNRGEELNEYKEPLDGGKELKEPETYADTIKSLRDEAERNGLSDDLIDKAGETLQNELNPLYEDINAKLDADMKLTEDKYLEAQRERAKATDALSDHIGKRFDDPTLASNPEYLAEEERLKALFKKAQQKVNDALDEQLKAETKAMETLSGLLKDKLSGVREMGIGNAETIKDSLVAKTTSKVKNSVRWAFDQYPTDWVKASINHGAISLKKVDRGYYSHYRNLIAISGNEAKHQRECSIHELGHRFEQIVPSILKQEKDFYDRRTKGESLEWLGYGFGRNEKSRKDDFLDSYMGKDYGGSAYELVSMGFQYAYTDPMKLKEDPDMQKWIFGLLCMA